MLICALIPDVVLPGLTFRKTLEKANWLFMDYQKTLDFLFSQLPAYHRIGKAAYRNDLGNTLALDEYLSHPHRNFRSIHIGGTNGKGSVSHMTASILMEAGYRTGLYTSPHLTDFRERIRVNGRMITKKYVSGFVLRHRKIIDSLKPSFFEMTVAMAFEYFASAGVEIAVVEVGLGGRLDSTNIISPVLSVITNIGHDHMDLLGDTLEKVAAEKAGIIKKGVPVVIGESLGSTDDIFIEAAAAAGSEIFFADRSFKCIPDERINPGEPGIYEAINLNTGKSFRGNSVLRGDYQAKNIQTVLQISDLLGGIAGVSEENVVNGIEGVVRNTGLQGRWQIVGKEPLTICDTGHNKEGLEYVVNQLRKTARGRIHFVIGFVSDKDLSTILPLLPAEALYYFTRADVPRALDENILMERAVKSGLKGNSYPDVESAVRAARSAAVADDLVFIGGSTFVVADALSVPDLIKPR